MAGTRKDNKGRVLKTGEYQRASDGRYVYQYKDPFGKTRCIYSKDLMKMPFSEVEKLLGELVAEAKVCYNKQNG